MNSSSQAYKWMNIMIESLASFLSVDFNIVAKLTLDFEGIGNKSASQNTLWLTNNLGDIIHENFLLR